MSNALEFLAQLFGELMLATVCCVWIVIFLSPVFCFVYLVCASFRKPIMKLFRKLCRR